jgi:hypothetical protein
MKRVVLAILFLLFSSVCYALAPNFVMHKLDIDVCGGCASETHIPVVIDYDKDGDMDILIVNRNGEVYVLENKLIDYKEGNVKW